MIETGSMYGGRPTKYAKHHGMEVVDEFRNVSMTLRQLRNEFSVAG